ncbi:DUF6427 family protein [Flavobacterium aciduliphilum]|uniref:Uncharacterized protein n=1 Tax=Flavobacterium aciduliphilum TaxID=1101402 RepID=A0A328YJF1_9FLAO|nr:DUF6427 family protein [Flavobacterium aciduliphilum]RAR72915.1 hypothetical protein CLV55_104176 [Flavobacterium aciduliphilum]
MITSVFKKSTPINYSLLGLLLVIFFLIYQVKHTQSPVSIEILFQKGAMLVLLFSSLFFSNFIVKKNNLTKKSSYTILFYFLFVLIFPEVLNDFKLLLSNLFVLLAMRRLVSLQSLKAPKEKIFDASLWIFVASIFNFWCILFLFLVYISIIFHVSRDYRNWLLPIIAFFTALILFIFYALLFDKAIVMHYIHSDSTAFELDYFKNDSQNIAFSVYVVCVLFFSIPSIFSLTNKPLNLQASYKKVIFATLIGIVLFVTSFPKNNQLLIFTFLPLAIMATNSIEYMQNKFQQEMILWVTLICSLVCFCIQL